MQYVDSLYGTWRLYTYIADLAQTSLARRARGISQSVFPNTCQMGGALPSRFHHGMGVVYLTDRALTSNRGIDEPMYKLLMASGLMHDFGNTCFAHLGETFLKKILGKEHDGESFLEVLLPGTDTEEVLKKYDISPTEVVSTIRGKTPESKILNGSMDVDNLDNVGRHAHAVNLSDTQFHAAAIADAFRWHEGEWKLRNEPGLKDEVFKWKQARANVYAAVYNSHTFPPHVMLHRALDLASRVGLLNIEFFKLDDDAALRYLLKCGVPHVEALVKATLDWNWFVPAYVLERPDPSEAHKKLVEDPNARSRVADDLAKLFRIPEEDIGVHLGKGRDHRRVTIKLLNERDETSELGDEEPASIYRCRVFVSSRVPEARRRNIGDYLPTLLGYAK